MSRTLRVVAGVFQSENQVLVCKRKPGKAAGGKWEFPGGKMEAGESAEEALRRELIEELNVQIANVGGLIWRETTTNSSSSVDLACYWVETDTFPISSTDHDELMAQAKGMLTRVDVLMAPGLEAAVSDEYMSSHWVATFAWESLLLCNC